jgi:hypothetical protein
MNDKPYPIAAIYGYAVCLVAIVAFIFCVMGFIGSVMDARNPLHTGRYHAASFASFENYKVDMLADKEASAYVPDDAAMLAMFEAAKEEHRAIVRYRARRSIVTSLLVTVISVVLFVIHFRWAETRVKAGEA